MRQLITLLDDSKTSFSTSGGIVVVFVADGRFHMEAFMIANPGIRVYLYEPLAITIFFGLDEESNTLFK